MLLERGDLCDTFMCVSLLSGFLQVRPHDYKDSDRFESDPCKPVYLKLLLRISGYKYTVYSYSSRYIYSDTKLSTYTMIVLNHFRPFLKLSVPICVISYYCQWFVLTNINWREIRVDRGSGNLLKQAT